MVEELRRVLHEVFGHTAFRPLQREAVEAFAAGRDVVLILPTGGGKSLCFQAPAVALARAGQGPTLVVSPLIALMEDQVRGLRARGVRAAALHSAVPWAEQRATLMDLASLELVYVSPERLQNARFRRALAAARFARAVVDEAHCISEWGHDFRPEYRALAFLKTELRLALMALTATATPAVAADIEASLALREPLLLRGSSARPNLHFSVHLADARQTSRAAWAADLLAARGFASRTPPGHAIVYATTRKRAQSLQRTLRKAGIRAGYYHAGRKDSARERAHALFEAGKTPVLVATSAYGMGIDIKSVRLVVHAEAPASLESYVQQAGRAGRDGQPAECWLAFSSADARTHAALQRGKRAWHAPRDTRLEERASAFEELAAYAQQTECRQRIIARHFGEPDPNACGLCDVCREPDAVAERIARAELARRQAPSRTALASTRRSTPLSADQEASVVAFIDALPKPLGRRLIVKGLRGSRARDALQKRLPANPHFAALKHADEAAIFAALDELLARGLLVRTGKKYPTLWVAGKPVRPRRQRTDVAGRAPRTLETSLKRYRRDQAKRLRLKPYQIFHNRTLLALCKERPQNEDQLLSIWGMGEARVRKYGADLLSLLAEADRHS